MGREDTISERRTTLRRPADCRKLRLRRWLLQASCLSLAFIPGLLLCPSTANAQQEQPNTIRNTFGEIGLLDMPSAHMAKDGELAFTFGDIRTTQRFSLAFQMLPWLEASFRYSHVPYWHGDPHYYDRSFGLKIRLLRESEDIPDLSVGIRDILGTGVYSSEYVATSKHFGPVDLTAGLGWGRLADNDTLPNPLGYIVPAFNTRPPPSSVATGGTVDFAAFFRGSRVGVFGGLAWQTPIDDLKLLAEYSSDHYTGEAPYRGGPMVRSPVNVGLNYHLDNVLSLTAGWYYGSTYGFAISLSGDPTETANNALRIGPPVPPAIVRDDKAQQSALSLMHDRNANASAVSEGWPWIGARMLAEKTKLDLMQALMSEAPDVRDIDLQDATLVVNAQSSSNAQNQCAQFAKIVSSVGTRATTIAVTDLQNPNGIVTFCPIPTTPKFEQMTIGDSPSKPDNTPQDTPDISQTDLEKKLRTDLSRQDIFLFALSGDESELWVYYENNRYRVESQAAGRIVRLLMADAPPSVEIFHLIPIVGGMSTQQITILRSAMERATTAHGTAAGLSDEITLGTAPFGDPVLSSAAEKFYPATYWSFAPKLTEHIFDPERPLQFMIFGEAAAGIELTPEITIGTVLTGNIWNNYTFDRSPNSQLPHVRTDLLQYLKQGAYGISSLQATYETRLARDIFAEATAGYLEDMFMGAGGQILWRPENSRFAFGADLYQVWKRDFDRLFGAQSYNVLTGHATIYYQSPWYGLNFNLHVGRYLAGDYGATFEVTRRFSTGVEIGAFATFTNVPFSKFGEGSFDKGIIIHIPFEWGLPIFSQSSYDLRLSSLTRDGGQRLANDDSLYEQTRRTSYGEIEEHLDDLVEP